LCAGQAVNVLAAGPPIGGHSELKRTVVVVQRDNILHAPLAVGTLAHDYRSVVILQAGGHDLTSAGAVAIDEHGHREALVGARGMRPIFLAARLVAALPALAVAGADDHAFLDEQIAHVYGGIE